MVTKVRPPLFQALSRIKIGPECWLVLAEEGDADRRRLLLAALAAVVGGGLTIRCFHFSRERSYIIII